LYFIIEQNKRRTANKIILDFHKQPTDFNEMFMKFYVTYIKNMETHCVKERKKTKCVPESDQIIKAKK